MNGFDLVLGAALVGVVYYESKGEVGRAFLDLLATILALVAARQVEVPLTLALHWKPAPGSAGSPLAFALVALPLWCGFVLLGRLIHSQTRFSLEAVDGIFSTVLGIALAATLGHGITETAIRIERAAHKQTPAYLAESALARELSTFRTLRTMTQAHSDLRAGGSAGKKRGGE